jgi:uracil-DNA glycosylase
MSDIGTFPFGQPVCRVVQRDRTKKRVFVLGVYASAVHARWIGADGSQKIGAVAVASEPEIFWRGSNDAALTIISAIEFPSAAGSLVPANAQHNGPSGKALDELFLQPLGLTRDDAWLCDLVPHSCMNEKQALALKREYDPLRQVLGLPAYNWPRLPGKLADERRRAEIQSELMEADAEIVITLGDQPLKWFTRYYGTQSMLSKYGQTPKEYGRLHSFRMAGREMQLLPLVHPRQGARLGSHSPVWAALHEQWVKEPPIGVAIT